MATSILAVAIAVYNSILPFLREGYLIFSFYL